MSWITEALNMDEFEEGPGETPETVPAEKKKVYTSEDYWNLPHGERAELIGGVLYKMEAPGTVHQRLVVSLAYELRTYVMEHQGSCEVFVAPFAVNLDADDSTWVEPDVLVVCDPAKLSDRACEGAPDLVIEVVSNWSRRRDYILKAGRYEAAGVREYWAVDPEAGQTMVCRFDQGEETPVFVPFDAAIPVGIWDDQLSVTVADLLG